MSLVARAASWKRSSDRRRASSASFRRVMSRSAPRKPTNRPFSSKDTACRCSRDGAIRRSCAGSAGQSRSSAAARQSPPAGAVRSRLSRPARPAAARPCRSALLARRRESRRPPDSSRSDVRADRAPTPTPPCSPRKRGTPLRRPAAARSSSRPRRWCPAGCRSVPPPCHQDGGSPGRAFPPGEPCRRLPPAAGGRTNGSPVLSAGR